MKKTIAIFLVAFCGYFTAMAQDNALGVRLTGGAEVSYQRTLNDVNRLEFNLGWGWNTTTLTGYYHWLFPITDGLKWYVGPGAGLGIFQSSTNLGVGGTIGIEYNFDIPLQLSLDWRPMFNFGSSHDNNYSSSNVGLGIRYRF
jgi:opacity protein-like surface antigen